MSALTKNLTLIVRQKLLHIIAAITLVVIGAGLFIFGLGWFDGTAYEAAVRSGLTALTTYLLLLFILFGR